MVDRDKVIKGLMVCFTRISCKNKGCPYESEYKRSGMCQAHLRDDALALLKALDVTPEELERLKMCRAECKIDCLLEHYNKVKDELDAMKKAQEEATIEPKRIDLEEETKAWLDKMDAVDALGNIANICIDWDGYRTANGLGGLVNEIWAYARYCADRLAKEQESGKVNITMTQSDGWKEGNCPFCGMKVDSFYNWSFCGTCGKGLKWK